MRVIFLTENFMRGGIDIFLVNLVKNWPSIDEITLYVNNEYEELVGFRGYIVEK